MFTTAELLMEKIQSLPPTRMAEVDDFVEFLRLKEQERTLTNVAMQASAPAFAAVWDNCNDEVYDAL